MESVGSTHEVPTIAVIFTVAVGEAGCCDQMISYKHATWEI